MLYSRSVFFFLLFWASSVLIAEPKPLEVSYADACLDNGIIAVEFDLEQGGFSVVDSKSRETLLSNASFKLPSGMAPDYVKVLQVEERVDELGRGKRAVLEVMDVYQFRYSDHRKDHAPPAHLYSFTLYENNPALILGFGLKTPDYMSTRLMKSQPIHGGRLFGGRAIENMMTLNGSAGAEATKVMSSSSLRTSMNSLMLTGEVDGIRRTAVWGGLKYNEFAAVAWLENNEIGLFSEDPVGRLVDASETYFAEDTLYLDVHTREPFEALERYGQAMRVANHARPNVYNFPVTCGWSVSRISKLPDINNSKKLIEELEHANRSGLTRYTDVSLRLEPDKYHFDTEQGWWDDERMRKFNHLVEPYDTIAKWSEAMRAGNGVPYIYMQIGMPSDDFAREYPQYMLFNDISKLDKVALDLLPRHIAKGLKHRHHRPYVTFDYTDREFSEYFVRTWRKLYDDGIRGVKVDYAATAWRPEGGFDDRYATTNSAYRRAFSLLREAFGEEGLIDERNLGADGRPCLDVTAGLIDTQRTWQDSNKFVPEMVSKSGLRWYKNRTVFNYYSDTKIVHDQSLKQLQSMLTLNFLTSGRLDLSSSYSLFTPEVTHAVSRTYPHYFEPITARPLDAFTGVEDPQVYDLELRPDWHQITLYNTGDEEAVIGTSLSGERVNNAIGLDPEAEYYAYEFWTDSFIGKLSGNDRLEQTVEPNYCAMISLRKVLPHPQVISTDRHLLQGWVDLEDVMWDAATKTLSGNAKVVGGEPFKIVLANNGNPVNGVTAEGAQCSTQSDPQHDLTSITLRAEESGSVGWKVRYQ